MLFSQTNDNMEMLSSLKSEQHISQELANRLSQQEDELNDMKQQVGCLLIDMQLNLKKQKCYCQHQTLVWPVVPRL